MVFTNVKYKHHFRALEDYSLLRRVPPESLKFCSTYFSVPKDDQIDRAIFNGRKLSSHFKTPEPVNLADIPRILKEINSTHQGLSMVCGDIRHWFHQLPMNAESQTFFGLAMEQSTYLWLCVPMGWSHSPVIAQGAAWILLGHFEPGEFVYVDIRNMSSLPMFVVLKNKDGKEVGFAVVFYDNYLISSRDPEVAEAMDVRIRRNAKLFSIVLKEHRTWSRRQLTENLPDLEPFHYLGVEIGFTVSRKSKRMQTASRTADHYNLRWRIRPKKTLGHIPVHLQEKEKFCGKEIAITVGRILYSRLIGLRMLGEMESTRGVLNLLRRTSRHAHSKGWKDEGLQITDDEKSSLKLEWSFYIENPWRTGEHIVSDQESIFLATDACDEGWAAVEISEGTIVATTQQRLFEGGLRTTHIFVKEMIAAVEGTKWILNSHPGCKRVVLIGDNTAVAGAIKRGYTSNALAATYLSQITGIGLQVHVVTVPSALNVADSPSRNAPCTVDRLESSWKAIMADAVGIKVGRSEKHPNLIAEAMKHPEELSDDDMNEDCFLDDPDP